MTYQKFTKDVGIISLTKLVVALGGLIVLPIITKLLGAENYGIWAQLMVTMAFITPLATLNLPNAILRFLPAEKNKKEIQDGIYSVLTITFGIALIIGLILIFFSVPISNFFGCEKILVQIFAFAAILECINLTLLSVFMAFQQTKKCSFFLIFSSLGGAGLIAIAVLLGYGLFGAVLSFLIIKLITFLSMVILIIKKFGLKTPSLLRTKEYLHFSLPLIPQGFSGSLVELSDRYLIGFFLGILFVGYYAPAYAIGNIIYLFVGPFAFLLPAILSKSYDENKFSEAKTYLKYSLKYFLLISIPSVFGLSILSKQLLVIFSTPEIAQQGYLVLPIVALSILLLGISVIISHIIHIKKKTRVSAAIWVGAALLNLGLNFIFIPRIGIMGAAITTLIAYTFVLISICYYCFKNLKFKFGADWKFIAKSVSASALMTLFIFWFSPIGLLKTVIAIVSGAILYGFLIFLFKGINKNEIEFFKEFLRKT